MFPLHRPPLFGRCILVTRPWSSVLPQSPSTSGALGGGAPCPLAAGSGCGVGTATVQSRMTAGQSHAPEWLEWVLSTRYLLWILRQSCRILSRPGFPSTREAESVLRSCLAQCCSQHPSGSSICGRSLGIRGGKCLPAAAQGTAALSEPHSPAVPMSPCPGLGWAGAEVTHGAAEGANGSSCT